MSRRWGTTPPLDPLDARDRLVTAAQACFDRQGVAKTTIDDVAREAHVSRATVYRYVRDRDELVLLVLRRESDRFLQRLREHLDGERRLDRALVESVVFGVTEGRRDPKLAQLVGAGAIPDLPGTWTVLYEQTLRALGPTLDRARDAGELRTTLSNDEIVEWVLRVVLSLLTVRGPVERDEDELRAYVRRVLVDGLLEPARSARR